MRRKTEAYFSVEAALILPLVTGAILLVIYLFLFQYDRCLMEQDMGALALRGSVTEAESEKELTEKLQAQAAGLYQNKYVAWDFIAMEIKLRQGRIETVGQGELRFPMAGWNFLNRDNIWENRVSYQGRRLSPVSFIRNFQKLKGGD